MDEMKATTIDNLDIQVHERYAKDQQNLDPRFTVEATSIAPHSEIAVTSAIYTSKWEELFELHVKNTPWALFEPPPKYHLQANRFFRARILPSFEGWEGQKNEEEEQGEKEGKDAEEYLDPFEELLHSVENFTKGSSLKSFEQDKSLLISLFEKVKYLNTLLNLANARKTQYQKG